MGTRGRRAIENVLEAAYSVMFCGLPVGRGNVEVRTIQ
jgi:hypothetical protein